MRAMTARQPADMAERGLMHFHLAHRLAFTFVHCKHEAGKHSVALSAQAAKEFVLRRAIQRGSRPLVLRGRQGAYLEHAARRAAGPVPPSRPPQRL